MALTEYLGAIHFHTNYSDGGGTMAEAVGAARDVGLDFIVPGDHDTVRPRRDGWDGWHDGVLVANAAEVSPTDGLHVLAFGTRRVRRYEWLTDREMVTRLGAEGAALFVAHPQGRSKGRGHVGAWRDWTWPQVSGFEVWSYLHDWFSRVRPWNIPAVVRDPVKYVMGPSPDVLHRWDQACRTRRLSAIAGLDNHNRRYLFSTLRVFPYHRLFRVLRTHVLCPAWSGDSTRDMGLLLDALVQGRCFVALDELADSRGFGFRAEGRAGFVQMGEIRAFAAGHVLRIRLPRPAEVTLVRDGRPIDQRHTTALEWPVDGPGVYRAEVRLDGRPWIYTNPIYVRDANWQGEGAPR